MAWQCTRDGSMNEGWRCSVCGAPPFTTYVVLTGSGQVIDVRERSRVIGSGDWASAGGMGLSSSHVRCFYSLDDHGWRLSSVTKSGQTWVNGALLTPGTRHLLAGGDTLQLGARVFLTVELHDLRG
ncbi:MAG: FHA domain-containing protein [Thermomicrobiales bacterium]